MPTIPPAIHDPVWRNKLAAILSQQDATEDGIVLASALAARRLLRAAGMTWVDVVPILLGPPQTIPDPASSIRWRDLIRECSARPDLLTPKERDFLASAITFPRLSPRQQSWLDAIAERVRGA